MCYHSTHDRNADFVKRCLDELRKPGVNFINPLEIIDRALAAPAPTYYADIYRAGAILRRALRDGGLPPGNYACSQMWRDMFADLQFLIKKYPAIRVGELIMRLCSGEAGHPRFYISRRRALELIKPHIHLVPVA